MRIIECEQGTRAWFMARAGTPTASAFGKIITPAQLKTGGSGSETYLMELLAERVLGSPINMYNAEAVLENKWKAAVLPVGHKATYANLLQRGSMLEEEARSWYTFQTGVEVESVGFVKHATIEAGCSPDALAIDPEARVDHTLLTKGMDWQARLALYQGILGRFVKTTKLPDNLRKTKLGVLQFHVGRAQLEGLQFKEARASFEQAIANNPTAKNANYYCFLAAYYLNDFDAAENFAAEYARASAPGFADVLRALETTQRVQIADMVRYLGDRAYSQKRIDNSRDLNHVTACLKDSADAWNNHAFLCRETKQFQQAYDSYLHAIEKEPNSPQLWNDGGVVLQYHLPNEKNLAKARTMYEKALQLAKAVLADKKATEQARKFATEARDNARANLLELDKLK